MSTAQLQDLTRRIHEASDFVPALRTELTRTVLGQESLCHDLVLALLAALRQFTDWFPAREQRHQRIAAARARAQASRDSQWLTP